MLPIGSLSEAAYGLRQLLVTRISDFESDIGRIRIGHPGTNLKDLEQSGENGLNLFFYQVDYDGYPSDGTADCPFYVRLYCLITAVCREIKKTDPDNTSGRDIGKGENELRLIGEVMRVLHQQPVFSLLDSENGEIATLQIVPYKITLDNLNHIWATQGSETPYRLSAAYEMSLAPVPYALPTSSSPLVGDPGMLSWGAMVRRAGKEKDGLNILKPMVDYLEIDTSPADWMPHLALVEKFGEPGATLHYVFKVVGSPAAELAVLIAGEEGEALSLFWNVWRRRKSDNSIVAWREDLADAQSPVVVIEGDTSGDPFFANRIDPQAIDPRQVRKVKLPTDIGDSDTKTWQATLYAVRSWQHAAPSGSGAMVTTKIKSNLLLLHGEGA